LTHFDHLNKHKKFKKKKIQNLNIRSSEHTQKKRKKSEKLIGKFIRKQTKDQ